MNCFSHSVAVQTVVGSFYNHANFGAVTKPQRTFVKLSHYSACCRFRNLLSPYHPPSLPASLSGSGMTRDIYTSTGCLE